MPRQPDGFARLRALCDSDPGVAASAAARNHTLHRAAVILAAKGGVLADITIGDFLELLDTEADVHGAARATAPPATGCCAQTGIFGPAAPARLRQLRTAGQRTPEELIDRHQLACRPIRDLLVDYLRERQPAIDYGSLEQLARRLGMFWADLEPHHPGIDSLHLPADVADALETAAAHQAEDHHGRRRQQDRDRRRADLPPRVPDPGPGLLPRPGPVGRR